MRKYNPNQNIKSLTEKRKVLQKFKESVLSVLNEIDTENLTDEQILRISIASELSAINLYQALAENTSNEFLKKLLLDITKEEKTHVGEFEKLLIELDSEQATEYVNGSNEVEKLKQEGNMEKLKKYKRSESKEEVYFSYTDNINDEDKPYIKELILKNIKKYKYNKQDLLNIIEEVLSNHDAGENITDKMIQETIEIYFE